MLSIGDVIDVEDKTFAVTGIISVFHENVETEEPVISYKIIMTRIMGGKEN